jgi:hypothetical protein
LIQYTAPLANFVEGSAALQIENAPLETIDPELDGAEMDADYSAVSYSGEAGYSEEDWGAE